MCPNYNFNNEMFYEEGFQPTADTKMLGYYK